jgi:hypothetical protein
MRLVINNTDLSVYTEPKNYTVKRKNIYDEINADDGFGTSIKRAVGCTYEIKASLTGIPHETAAAINASMLTPECEVTFTMPEEFSEKTLTFSRPEVVLTAVRSMSDGDYFDETITLSSEKIYSDDCL